MAERKRGAGNCPRVFYLQNYFFQINVNQLTQTTREQMKIVKDIFEVSIFLACMASILFLGTILEAVLS